MDVQQHNQHTNTHAGPHLGSQQKVQCSFLAASGQLPGSFQVPHHCPEQCGLKVQPPPATHQCQTRNTARSKMGYRTHRDSWPTCAHKYHRCAWPSTWTISPHQHEFGHTWDRGQKSLESCCEAHQPQLANMWRSPSGGHKL